jgi:hypothetical protein
MTSLKDYLPADLQPVVTVTESVEGVIGMTALNPINRLLQLAGVAPLEETHPAAQQAAIAIAKKQANGDMEEGSQSYASAIKKLHIKDQAALKKATKWMKQHNKTAEQAGQEFGLLASHVKTLKNISQLDEEDYLAEADAAGTIDQLVQVATNLPQYKGNAEAARLYTMGTLLAAIYQNIKQNPPQTTVAQGKVQELSILGAMSADLIKTSQTMMRPQTATPAQGQPSAQAPGYA